MRIIVNGTPRDVPQGRTLADLIADLGLSQSVCAAEINRRVIPRAERPATPLAEGDQVEVVTLVGGG